MKRALVPIVFAASLLANCSRSGPPPSHGALAAATPEATEAGARILRAGGNAADAAVAISFALGVTEPAMSGLGGQTQIVMFRPGQGALVINGTSISPAATLPDATEADLAGFHAATVPTTVKTLDYLWRHYGSGTLTWAELLTPAIEYAENGFRMGSFREKVFARHAEDLQSSPSTAELLLEPDGTVPQEGTIWKQPILAKTLRRLAEVGADDFYHGDIARAIAEDMRAHGGWIAAEDLNALPEPVELPALHGTYRGYDVWTLPPPGGGWVVLRMLRDLEGCLSEVPREKDDARTECMLLTLRAGHRARLRAPITDLHDYESEVEERLRGETTHFSVVDGGGFAVSVTASINGYFGARVANTELGFLYNDYMREFRLGASGQPYGLAPKAMPYSSMSPTIVTKDGEVRLVVGSPGSARILSAVTQVIQRWVDEEMTVEEAVAAYRLHALPDGRFFVEGPPLPSRLVDSLADKGLMLSETSDDLSNGQWNPYFGGVQAVSRENGALHAAADPRRDGSALVVSLTSHPN
jgi:gamma-glutamyltranspeptidase/glutathione hydrolase